MDPFGLIPAIAGFFERYVARRQRITLRADTAEHAMLSVYPYDEAHTVVNRLGIIRIHNGGPSRVTINGAGWEAKDGTTVEAHLPRASTLDPGDPELTATGDPTKLVDAGEAHGGLVRMYVEVAGEAKRRNSNLPAEWITKVRVLAGKDRRR
jgi:hypothetical protein